MNKILCSQETRHKERFATFQRPSTINGASENRAVALTQQKEEDFATQKAETLTNKLNKFKKVSGLEPIGDFGDIVIKNLPSNNINVVEVVCKNNGKYQFSVYVNVSDDQTKIVGVKKWEGVSKYLEYTPALSAELKQQANQVLYTASEKVDFVSNSITGSLLRIKKPLLQREKEEAKSNLTFEKQNHETVASITLQQGNQDRLLKLKYYDYQSVNLTINQQAWDREIHFEILLAETTQANNRRSVEPKDLAGLIDDATRFLSTNSSKR